MLAYHQVPGCLFSAADPWNMTRILGVQHSEHSILSVLQAGGSRKKGKKGKGHVPTVF